MKWINVEKKKPKKYHPVIATDGKHFDILWMVDEYHLMDIPTGHAYWSPIKGMQYFNGEINLKNITHWMEFPELPKKSSNKMEENDAYDLEKNWKDYKKKFEKENKK
jgi:hypothetical protein